MDGRLIEEPVVLGLPELCGLWWRGLDGRSSRGELQALEDLAGDVGVFDGGDQGAA
jgi:hypothetical protein